VILIRRVYSRSLHRFGATLTLSHAQVRTRSSSSTNLLEGKSAGEEMLAEGVNLLRPSRTDGNIASLS
jgi:hypothetical protein